MLFVVVANFCCVYVYSDDIDSVVSVCIGIGGPPVARTHRHTQQTHTEIYIHNNSHNWIKALILALWSATRTH